MNSQEEIIDFNLWDDELQRQHDNQYIPFILVMGVIAINVGLWYGAYKLVSAVL